MDDLVNITIIGLSVLFVVLFVVMIAMICRLCYLRRTRTKKQVSVSVESGTTLHIDSKSVDTVDSEDKSAKDKKSAQKTTVKPKPVSSQTITRTEL